MTPLEGGHPYTATVVVDDHWLRLLNGNRRVGAWSLSDVKVERLTVFRFNLRLDGASMTFAPDDPAGFAESLDVVVDLRPKSRFGLGERVRKAKEELEAAQASSDR